MDGRAWTRPLLLATWLAGPAAAVEWGPDRVALSGPIANLDDGEGEQFRLSLPAVRLLNDPFEVRFDAVLGHVDANSLSGQPGGQGTTIGIDLVLAKAVGRWLVDGGAGMQRSLGTRFPSDGTRFNFTLYLGAYWTGLGPLQLGARYFHISNADVVSPNSGYDAVQWVVGYRW